jgi:hypothetical protein
MCAGLLCVFGGGNYFFDRNQLLPNQCRLMMCRLRTVTAVLRTASGFHGVKKALLNVPSIVMFTMFAMGLIKQIEEGLAVELEGSRWVRTEGLSYIAHWSITSRHQRLHNEGFIAS